MALTNNFLPQTSLVFGVRDYLPQLQELQSNATKGLQNAFKFGTQVYDYNKQRQVADALQQGDTNEAAYLDAQRINNQDPTSIFRWKLSQEQAKQIHDENLAAQKAQREMDIARVEAEKAKAKEEAKQHMQNKLNSYLPTMTIGLNTTPEQVQQYANTLAGLEAEANNYGIDDPRIAELKASFGGDLPYSKKVSALQELKDIDKNYGKGTAYDGLNEQQKYNLYQRKLEFARDRLMKEDPALWEMLQRDGEYNRTLMDLMSDRNPKSKAPKGKYEL